MPPKRVQKRYKKNSKIVRRKKRGKRSMNKLSTSFIKSPFLFPDRTICKMVYNERIDNNLTIPANSQIALRQFRGNGLYDPDIKTGNRGCYGFSEYATIYGKYRVMASKIIVKLINRTGGSTYRATVLPSDLASDITAGMILNAAAVPYSKSKYISILGTEPTVITNYMTTYKMEGDKGAKVDTTFASVTGNVPPNQWYWNVILEAITPPIDSETGCYIDVQIIYYVEFYSRNALSNPLLVATNPPVNDEDIRLGPTGPTGPSG